MSNRYPGGFITLDEPTVNSTSAKGVWTLEQQADYQGQGVWPTSMYQISRSLRFNSADSAYLTRTPASAGSRTTWTWSGWVKRGALGSTVVSQYFTSAYTSNSDAGFFGCRFTDEDRISITGYTSEWLHTQQVFRDTSAWYHVVVVLDTTLATADNRVRLYINGSEVTVFVGRVNPSQNAVLGYNGSWAHTISSNTATPNQFFNGYLADINFVDGGTPSTAVDSDGSITGTPGATYLLDFGEFSATTGVWTPKRFSGPWNVGTGVNGFYLNFSDNSNTTATTLGKDSSGNGNNWTPSGSPGFSVAAGAGNDSLVDTPTQYGTDTGAGGEVRGNYCTLNPLDKSSSTTLSNGNLDVSISAAWNGCRSTIGMSSGKWYWEVQGTTITSHFYIGIATAQQTVWEWSAGGPNPYAWIYISATGQKSNNGTTSAYGASYTDNDVIGVAFDADNGTLTFYKNGVSQGTAFTGLTSGPYFAGVSSAGVVANFNFGQRPFAYTAPSGFKALVTTNLPEPTILQGDQHFNTTLWTGDSTSNRTITTGLQSDFVWVKNRSSATGNLLFDVIRGAGKTLYSESTGAEINQGSYYVQQFNSDNFLIGNYDTAINASGNNYVSWVWKANGAGVSNTDGTITSTVSANTTAGISIVTWTGNSSNADGVGHGLGVAPKIVIYKKRNGTSSWYVWTTAIDGSNDELYLNQTAAAGAVSAGYGNITSTTISNWGWTTSDNMVAYCFAPISGYSAMGSFVGTGTSDGPFIFTGFRPSLVLLKPSSTTGDWAITDNKRQNPFNVVNGDLTPNANYAEGTFGFHDFLSNGFKTRATNPAWNVNGVTYIYMAFAENPFKNALAR